MKFKIDELDGCAVHVFYLSQINVKIAVWPERKKHPTDFFYILFKAFYFNMYYLSHMLLHLVLLRRKIGKNFN